MNQQRLAYLDAMIIATESQVKTCQLYADAAEIDPDRSEDFVNHQKEMVRTYLKIARDYRRVRDEEAP